MKSVNNTIAVLSATVTMTLASTSINNVYAQSVQLPQMTLHIDKAQKEVSPTLYGLMTEEINFSYEGGLYAQLIRNVSFKDDRNGIQPNPWAAWTSGGPKYWEVTDSTKSNIRLDLHGGYNKANPIALIWKAQEGAVLTNEGYWGFPIRSKEHYRGSIIAKVDNKGGGDLEVSLVSNDGKNIYATTIIKGLSDEWQKLSFEFDAPHDVTPTRDVKFHVKALQGGEFKISKVTLFPETYNNRENGLRKDLMGMMRQMSPKFLRFPGGNYLEGNDFRNRFDWKKTIGNVDDRPGHWCPWGYHSTDGLGLLEFLTWAEDIGAEPLLGVFAGYVLSGDYVTADYVDGFVKDALDEIEYIIGDSTTYWGAQRIRDGHPAPFPLHYVEIGNEDFVDGSASYPGRYKKFYDAIKVRYPQLQLISTIDHRMMAGQAMQTGVKDVQVDIIDEHYYRNTVDMYRAATQYDSYDRKGPKVFCGEWATREGGPTSNFNAALGDAAWMTGMERNSDIVIAHCYAPLFVNVNEGGMQWDSNLIGYDALTAYGSPSYYAQCMFANNVGNKIVPIETQGMPNMDCNGESLPQLYYSATTDTKLGKTYLKVVNGGDVSQNVSIRIEGGKVSKTGKKIVLSSDETEDTNTINQPRKIVPTTYKQKAGNKFTINIAPKSINVIIL